MDYLASAELQTSPIFRPELERVGCGGSRFGYVSSLVSVSRACSSQVSGQNFELLPPNPPPRPTSRFYNRNHGVFLNGTDARIGVALHNAFRQVANSLCGRGVECRFARRTKAVRDSYVSRCARAQAQRRSHQAGDQRNLESNRLHSVCPVVQRGWCRSVY